MNNIKGDPTGLVLYFFDQTKFGEAVTRPDLRVCPLRDAVYQKLVRNVLQARCGSDTPEAACLQAGEVGVLLDGGRKGNTPRLLAPWREGTTKDKKNKGKSGQEEDEEDDDDEGAAEDVDEEDSQKPGFVPSTLQIVLTEQSLAARRKYVRGTASIKQMVNATVVSHKKVCLPERPRRHYPGTNSGDVITGVELPPLDSEWHLSVGDKKKLYGKKNLIPVGGKTAGRASSQGHILLLILPLVTISLIDLKAALPVESCIACVSSPKSRLKLKMLFVENCTCACACFPFDQ